MKALLSVLLGPIRFVLGYFWRRRLKKNIRIIQGSFANNGLEIYGSEEIVSITGEHYEVLGGEDVIWRAQFTETTIFEAPYYTVHHNAVLVGHYAVAISRDDEVLLESSLNSKGYLMKTGDGKVIQKQFKMESHTTLDVAFSLVNVLSKSYFHWVYEVLPTLEAYFFYIQNGGKTPKLILDKEAAAFQMEYLKLLGIEEESIYYWPGGKVEIQALVLPSLRYNRLEVDDFWGWHFYSRSGLQWLSETIRERSVRSSYPQKVYIPRRDNRRVLNNSELANFLVMQGFSEVYLEDLNVLEQITLFFNMQELVVVHGAAIANSIYSTNLKIIELFPDKRNVYFTYHYFQSSAYFGHKHHLLFCKSDRDDNITVDINDLREAFE